MQRPSTSRAWRSSVAERRHSSHGVAVAIALLCGSSAALAGTRDGALDVELDSRRVLVQHVVPECRGARCRVDLGASPPVGASRRIERNVVERAIGRAGYRHAGLKIPAASRVSLRAQTWSAPEWAEWVTPRIRKSLPAGVTLARVTAKAPLRLPRSAALGAVTLPRLPRRAGSWNTAATIEVLHDGATIRRVPTLVRVVISAAAARADVPRGQGVTLVIRRHSATISTRGLALKDADVGEVVPFRVLRTGRVVRGRVESKSLAEVLDPT